MTERYKFEIEELRIGDFLAALIVAAYAAFHVFYPNTAWFWPNIDAIVYMSMFIFLYTWQRYDRGMTEFTLLICIVGIFILIPVSIAGVYAGFLEFSVYWTAWFLWGIALLLLTESLEIRKTEVKR